MLGMNDIFRGTQRVLAADIRANEGDEHDRVPIPILKPSKQPP